MTNKNLFISSIISKPHKHFTKKNIILFIFLSTISVFSEMDTFSTPDYLPLKVKPASAEEFTIYSASPIFVDWDKDGKKDIIAGLLYRKADPDIGFVVFYKNTGTTSKPNFQNSATPLVTDQGKVISTGAS